VEDEPEEYKLKTIIEEKENISSEFNSSIVNEDKLKEVLIKN